MGSGLVMLLPLPLVIRSLRDRAANRRFPRYDRTPLTLFKRFRHRAATESARPAASRPKLNTVRRHCENVTGRERASIFDLCRASVCYGTKPQRDTTVYTPSFASEKLSPRAQPVVLVCVCVYVRKSVLFIFVF